MKLRNVEVVGFKSFRDRVSIDLSDGMTCIVGPNGCGKSNVVDAIKWAMGDMSPKSLRGDSMSDVIFAGTEKRKPAGMAEVTLTFENSAADPNAPEGKQTSLEDLPAERDRDPDGDHGADQDLDGPDWDLGEGIPREFRNVAEIAITRRLHCSGESEYLINKVKCRLRDIQNLLAGTGLGKQGYSIIEQGQIGFIVNARPSERRLIIEEASGITRYKDRRKRAARKLERTRQNLVRTRDILDEIEKRMKSLQSQAEKAKEHRKISAELRRLEIALLLSRRSEAATRAAKLEKSLLTAKRKAAESHQQLEQAEKLLKSARVEAHQAESRHADLTENYYKVETRLNLAKSNRAHALETGEEAQQRRHDLRAERQSQKQRRIELGAELARAREDLEALRERPDKGGREVARLESKLEKLKSKRRREAAQRDELRSRVEERRQLVRRAEDRLQWISEQVRELQERSESGDRELEKMRHEVRELNEGISKLAADYEKTGDEVDKWRSQVDRFDREVRELKERRDRAASREEKLARKKVELQTRIDSLQELRRRGQGYEQGVRRVLEWAEENGRDDILGPVGDFLKVPPGQEAAYAAFLGPRLGDVFVRNRETALEILQLLSTEEAGRVGCLPIPEGIDDPTEFSELLVEGLEVVDALDGAPDTNDGSRRRGWATSEGDVLFGDGRIVGGATGDQAEAVLRQVRELEALCEELDEVNANHGDASDKLDSLREQLHNLEEQLEQARKTLNQSSHQLRGLEQELEGEKRQKARVTRRLEQLEAEHARLEETGAKLLEERRELTERRQELLSSIPADEDELADAQGAVDAVDEELEHLGSELTDRKVEVAQIDERRRHLEANVQRLEKAGEHTEKQIEKLGRDIEEQIARGDESRMRAEALAGEIDRLEENHEKLSRDVDEAQSALEEVGERVEGLELRLLGARQDLDEAKQGVQKLEMKQQEAQLAVRHSTEQLRERFELDVGCARREVMDLETPPADRESKAEKLKRKLRRLGEVNALAIEEYEETKERYTFHTEQQDDLEESVQDLRAAIERMDMESRKRFAETFEAVNEQFQQVFPRLFRGGSAELILTEPDDLLETGVDIEVQPPGKNLQNVSLLSGGEKALTAVSLIFSIFLLKPTPFAVLDEVDAPLDEANVGRFADMVSELSETSQMIVITHNRRTMEAPERLYGVTMEEAGISKVVSVALSEVDDRLAS